MRRRTLILTATLLPLAASAPTLHAAGLADNVVFMEPVPGEPGGGLPTYRRVDDPERLATYRQWLANGSARIALDLHDRAWRVMHDRAGRDGPAPAYHVALVDGGNHADIGFRVQGDGGIEEHPDRSYIKLSPRPSDFANTLLHETGHVVLATLTGGRRIPARPVAAIPHTTAALTNRGTAFNEGFAIHLETLAAHVLDEPDIRAAYRHERTGYGEDDWRRSEYFRQAIDLRTYSQTFARYYEVRENSYAFAAAYTGPDYLRAQLEKARDFATLRNPNQLLQSEGFHASVFFAYTVRGASLPAPETVRRRHDLLLAALAETFAAAPLDPERPYLLDLVPAMLQLDRTEGAAFVDVLLDLSHGVFVDPEAARMWRESYLAALCLDIQGFPPPGVPEARVRWREAVLADPSVLHARLGPQLVCMIPQRTVRLVAFGRAMPLSFDVNTVQEGIIRSLPDMTDELAGRWMDARADRPFADELDFRERLGSGAAPALAHLRFRPPGDRRGA